MVIWWPLMTFRGKKKVAWTPGHVFFWWLKQGPKVDFFVSFVETWANLRFCDSLTWITGKYWEQIAQNIQNLGKASCPNFGPTWPAHPMSYPQPHSYLFISVPTGINLRNPDDKNVPNGYYEQSQAKFTKFTLGFPSAFRWKMLWKMRSRRKNWKGSSWRTRPGRMKVASDLTPRYSPVRCIVPYPLVN